ERRRSAPTGTGGGLLRLERPPLGDPPLDVVETSLTAELVELLQHVRGFRRACPRLPVARVRRRSRVYETSHTCGPLTVRRALNEGILIRGPPVPPRRHCRTPTRVGAPHDVSQRRQMGSDDRRFYRRLNESHGSGKMK